MDVSEWDPSKDKYIAVKYDVSTVSFCCWPGPLV
jgi:hypothetical protein